MKEIICIIICAVIALLFIGWAVFYCLTNNDEKECKGKKLHKVLKAEGEENIYYE